jgi:hypothetical protein
MTATVVAGGARAVGDETVAVAAEVARAVISS